MILRQARPEDVRAIARYIVMAEGEMALRLTGSPDPETAVEALLPYITSPEPCRYSMQYNIVAEVAGKAAGSIIAFPADSQPQLDIPLLNALNERGHKLDKLFFEGEPHTFYLGTMGVEPQRRGRGIGTALMGAAEEEGRKQGFDRASLLVDMEKKRTRKMYERLGYEAIGEVVIVTTKFWRMVKKLMHAPE